MKSKILLILFTLLLEVSFSQNLDNGYDISDKFNDKGHWIGFNFGSQTKPKHLDRSWKANEWLSYIIAYEYRFDQNFSLLANYHNFYENISIEKNKSAFEIEVKFREKVDKRINLSIQGGLALGLISYTGFEFPYGASIEYLINHNISVLINAKTYIVPDYGYWLSFGVSYKAFN